MIGLHRVAVVCLVSAVAALAGCSSNDDASASPPASGQGASAQLPPTTGFADIDAWLAKGDYKAWHCEPAPHEARSPSPHGMNRICSNDALSAHGDGEYPVGAAAVKELYDATGASIIGYAISRHVQAGTTGATWYWYERNPAVGAPPKSGSPGLVADGVGGVDGTPEQTICVGCHAGAGSDAMHAGHDFVYTQVR